jgi:hypothetical protein
MQVEVILLLGVCSSELGTGEVVVK